MISRRKIKGGVLWEEAPDIEKRLNKILKIIRVDWIGKKQIFAFRSYNSSSRSYARIWGLPRIWQMALKIAPAYVIEVLSEKFDRLPDKEKDKVLVHEIAHIPKNFSGSLVPHIRKRGKRNFNDSVNSMFDIFKRSL